MYAGPTSCPVLNVSELVLKCITSPGKCVVDAVKKQLSLQTLPPDLPTNVKVFADSDPGSIDLCIGACAGSWEQTYQQREEGVQ